MQNHKPSGDNTMNITEQTEKTTEKKAKKPGAMAVFTAVIDRAEKNQGLANADWKEATWRAVEFAASKARNLAPMNILIARVHACKSLRTMALVEYFKALATVDGTCLVEWSAKDLKFTYDSKETIPEGAIAQAKKVAFWEFKPENIHSMVKFDMIVQAIKKVRNKATEGKALVTADELRLLAAIEKLMVKADPRIFESKAGKKSGK